MNTNFSRPTLEDISNEIHISRTTIYKVLNHKGNVSDKTRELVLNALEKYHYVPNNNARNLALNKQYTIALVDFESRDAAYFASSIERGIKQAISDFGDHGLSVQCYTAPADRLDRQAADIQTALDAGIRHFIIAAADADNIRPVLIRLKSMGCTVILLSKDMEQAPCDAFIGIDEYKSGCLAGELVGKMLPGDGKLQILVAKESSSNIAATKTRLEGFLEGISAFPHVRLSPVLHDLSGSVQITEALHKVLQDPGLSAVFDLTYHLELICRILHQEDRRQLTLVGMDLFPEIRPYIADRTIDAIIFQNLEAQTHLACRLLFEKMCYGREITQDKYYSKLEIVMSGNLEYFL